MSYVMVPVPEEHAVEVMSYVIRLIKSASIEDWDEKNITEFFRDADEASRSLLSIVARAVNASKELTDQQAADLIELSGRETLGIVREVNEAAQKCNRTPMLFVVPVTEELPNGSTREKRTLTMATSHARWVRDFERELQREESTPLDSSAG